jgi:membrane-bound lytic murein transglycosylase F
MRTVRDRTELKGMLRRGEGDLIAARVIPERMDEERVLFTDALYETQPVIVQRTGPPEDLDLPDGVEDLVAPDSLVEPVEIRVRQIERAGDLADERVHVAERSDHYVDRLIEISDSITGDVTVVEVEGDVTHERLVRQVARGEIELAASQENLAEISASYYSNVRVQPTVGPRHDIAWAVRDNAPGLRETLNTWIAGKKADGTLDALYRKYFIDRRAYHERVESEYLTSETGRLSPYDDILRTHAARINWDWRLLASLAFQESRFDASARSWAGATGLIQLMPATAREYGVGNMLDPEDNVRGGVDFLAWLTSYWEDHIHDPEERRKFILASYNTGHGHVGDARRLAEHHGDDPDYWEDVAFWLLRKSMREWNTHPVVRFGYSRGIEPVTYVQKRLERYEHYQEFVRDRDE